MKYPYEPVRGKFIPIDYCHDCGKPVIDNLTMRLYSRQQWGKCNWSLAREKGAQSTWWWFGVNQRCHVCGGLFRQREREKMRDADRQRTIRNCCVCGDPFYMFAKRSWIKARGKIINEIVCSKATCKKRVINAFSIRPYRAVRAGDMFRLTENAVYCGRGLFAQVTFSICELIYLSRTKAR